MHVQSDHKQHPSCFELVTLPPNPDDFSRIETIAEFCSRVLDIDAASLADPTKPDITTHRISQAALLQVVRSSDGQLLSVTAVTGEYRRWQLEQLAARALTPSLDGASNQVPEGTITTPPANVRIDEVTIARNTIGLNGEGGVFDIKHNHPGVFNDALRDATTVLGRLGLYSGIVLPK